MPTGFECRSPIDGRLVAARPYADGAAVRASLAAARSAQRAWAATPLAERVATIERFCGALLGRKAEVAREITLQMGRPIRYAPLEVERCVERARAMASLAPEALADVVPAPTSGFRRFVRREPLGVVLVLAPWNYPLLTAVNGVVPALLAGNAVVLKHATQTPLCAERFGEAFAAAGLPEGVFQALHMTHDDAARAIGDASGPDFVAFTGSVEGGHAIQRAASERFLATNLELGGKDPAYVRADADLAHAVENLVDGAFFNSGQSCCGIERIYVHERLFDAFVEGAAALSQQYVLGDPLDPATTLGPLVRTEAAELVRAQIDEALAKGAKALLDPRGFPADRRGTPYLAPQILVGVDHGMRVMQEESFGPVVGVMPVRDDDEAVRLMNDSRYGLTAAIWSRDAAAAEAIGARLDTGTVFLNRCDYLDPFLAWSGVKDSGRGCSLSRLGFEALTRPKSYHLRLAP
jgi:acyl-CoA reductase-like NAD-dependent aldehyde dehydrogenase